MISKTIVFVHGMFENPKAWNGWKKYFEEQGYACHAPAYPYHEGEPSYLREHIDPRLGTLTLKEVIKTFSDFVETLSQKPILIGHSMGGLIVQKLVAAGKAAAGVCINSVAPKGIFVFAGTSIKSSFPIINPFKGDAPYLPDINWLHYAFCNTLTLEETKDVYEALIVPESRNVARNSLGSDASIDFKNPHAPLLFVAGEKDNLISPQLNRKNFEAYPVAGGPKEFKQFSGRTHYILGQKGWEEVAEFVLSWLRKMVE